MNRPALALSAALIVSIALAAMHARDAQRERARANALAMQLSEHEPLEKGGTSPAASSDPRAVRVTQTEPAVETSAVASAEIDTPIPTQPIMAHRGTHRTRQFVDRLQSALASGTPLQAYQIQPLIDAIDDVSRETEALGAHDNPNGRIVQAAVPILFESQLDQLVSLLEAGEFDRMN